MWRALPQVGGRGDSTLAAIENSLPRLATLRLSEEEGTDGPIDYTINEGFGELWEARATRLRVEAKRLVEAPFCLPLESMIDESPRRTRSRLNE